MSVLNTTSSEQPDSRTLAPPVPPMSEPAKSRIISEMASQSATNRPVDAKTRQAMIAEAAYYRAEKRGFAPGHDLDDWLEAEALIEVVTAR